MVDTESNIHTHVTEMNVNTLVHAQQKKTIYSLPIWLMENNNIHVTPQHEHPPLHTPLPLTAGENGRLVSSSVNSVLSHCMCQECRRDAVSNLLGSDCLRVPATNIVSLLLCCHIQRCCRWRIKTLTSWSLLACYVTLGVHAAAAATLNASKLAVLD